MLPNYINMGSFNALFHYSIVYESDIGEGHLLLWELHQKDTRGKAQMTPLKSKHWDTAPRHQGGNQTALSLMTTPDFYFILPGNIVAAKPHTLGHSYYKPFFKRVRWDRPGV